MSTISNASTKPVGPRLDLLTEKVAIDCELMKSNIGQVLGRVSVVNYEGETIFETFVCYPDPIEVTNTDKEYSRIEEKDIDPQNGAQLFPEVQAQLVELFRDRIVVGHGIDKDLAAIELDLAAIELDLRSHILRFHDGLQPPTLVTFNYEIRDTKRYRGYRQYRYADPNTPHPWLNAPRPSLEILALRVLGRQIKQSRTSSVEGAVAIMELYRKSELGIDLEQSRETERHLY
jgi:RNA exonuclease 4